MSIIDLTSMGEPQKDIKNEINNRLKKLQDEISEFCYQCAKCTSGCEAHKLLELEPHKIVALIKRGLIDEMVNSDVIWTCMSCLKCRERCPQKVEIADVIYVLRNIAIKKGIMPNIYSEFASALLNEGRIVKVSKFVEQKRPTLGLPPIKETGVSAINKILSATGFNKLQKKEIEQ